MIAVGSQDKDDQEESKLEERPLEKEYIDSNFWKVDHLSEKSVEELMEEENF